MKVLKILALVTIIAMIGACGLLKEKNEGALASTYSSLYAFFDTQSTGTMGCFPNTSNSTYVAEFTLRAMYSFQIERPSTLVVCVKNTTTYDTNNNNVDGFNHYMAEYQIGLLGQHTISLFASNSKINPGRVDTLDLFRIPVLGTLARTPALGYSGTVCPFFSADNTTLLVGKFNMDSLTDYTYIVIMDDTCGGVVGTGQSPFTLAKQYGVTFP